MTAGEYAQYLAQYGGMATCGAHLGVMVGPRKAIKNCPCGWIFIALEDATPERVQETLDLAKRGRSAWPPKVSWDKQTVETARA